MTRRRVPVLATLVVAVMTVAFVILGMWQLDRHRQRERANEAARTRFEAPALTGLGGVDSDSVYRRVSLVGVYDPSEEVLIRSQVHRGVAGFHVITPLVTGDGTVILVNRGWVPLEFDTAPVDDAPPPVGETVVEGWIAIGQTRPRFGPTDPPTGRLEVLSRVDIGRIQQQTSHALAPVYVVASGEGEALPVPAPGPDLDDAGPHLGYAVQWFGFAAIALVGYVALMRRRLLRTPAPRPPRSRNDPGAVSDRT
ncbi:MAG: SURF1 family protein [Actinobacteria bacterium]|nr:SURF1 family protein [Actinomycetota bacterium]